jgi:hypothetical protein
MKKVIKTDNRKKAFLGALIGGVASIAGSAIGAAKRRKAEREKLKQQQIEQNQNDAKAQAQALTASVADQDYVDEYNKKVTLKMGGDKKFNDRIKSNKTKSNRIFKCGGRKKAEMGSLIGQGGVGGEIGDAMSGIGGLTNSLFAPSSAPKQVKKADGFSTTGPKINIKTPDYVNSTNNNNTNTTANPNTQQQNNQFADRSNALRCGGKKRIKRK